MTRRMAVLICHSEEQLAATKNLLQILHFVQNDSTSFCHSEEQPAATKNLLKILHFVQNDTASFRMTALRSE